MAMSLPSYFDVHGNEFAILGTPARTNRQNLTLLGFLLDGIRYHNPTFGYLLFFDGLDYQTVG
jgi:hypothetical protein